MQSFLDIAGSFVIGALMILILINLKVFTSTSAAENLHSNISQENLVATASVIEHDVYKIGYRVSGEYIAIADSSELKFYCDIDNNGTKDSIHYFLGDPSQMWVTFNPNDKILFRTWNNETPKPSSVVVDFKLVYHDSLGAVINYSLLNNASSRSKIKTISTSLLIQSADLVDGFYQGAEWQKNIIPKNL
jgi:hypothetical protein